MPPTTTSPNSHPVLDTDQVCLFPPVQKYNHRRGYNDDDVDEDDDDDNSPVSRALLRTTQASNSGVDCYEGVGGAAEGGDGGGIVGGIGDLRNHQMTGEQDGDTRSEYSITDYERMKFVQEWLNSISMFRFLRVSTDTIQSPAVVVAPTDVGGSGGGGQLNAAYGGSASGYSRSMSPPALACVPQVNVNSGQRLRTIEF